MKIHTFGRHWFNARGEIGDNVRLPNEAEYSNSNTAKCQMKYELFQFLIYCVMVLTIDVGDSSIRLPEEGLGEYF